MPKPAPPTLLSHATGYWISQSLYVAAKLRIADLLVDAPQTAEQLAAATDVQPEPLYRLLRALASVGYFREDDAGRFALTPPAEPLRSDVEYSQRATVIMMGEEHYEAWKDLLYSVRTGKNAFEKVFGAPAFDWLSKHPEQAANFDAAMVGVHGRETQAMLEAYDFSEINVLADVGGGNGSVLCHVLARYSNVRGMLCDLPGVIERAKRAIADAGMSERIQAIETDFFAKVPSGADAYLMRHIIHDWDDEKSTRILTNIRRAMKPDGRVLVIEGIIPSGNDPSFSKLLDLNMLVIPGGKERTEQEYRELYQAAGLKLTSITPTPTEVSVIEGRLA